MPPTLALGLLLALVSAAALNWGFFVQHGAAASLPPLSPRRPIRSLRSLFGSRRWVRGFVTGLAGWALYVAALALAPLSLVQAASAGGVGLLALLAWHASGSRPPRRERRGVGLAVGGLALLAVSLAGQQHVHGSASWAAVAAWLAVSGLLALAALLSRSRVLGAGAAFGVAAGLLYGAGDVATKAATGGGPWLALVPVVLAFHGLAFVALQLGFQRGGALATAGVATLLTNALPIAAGTTIFHEPVPSGLLGAARVGAYAAVVAGAALLTRSDASAGEPGRRANDRLPRARHVVAAALAVAFVGFTAGGALGAYRYVHNFWLYRGFAPPRDPGFVTQQGTTQRFHLASPALGGRRQLVEVYLPPGYAASPRRRYPVLYLLHGFPGEPGAFLLTVKAGVDEDVLVARHRMQPLILVMPFGSTSQFTDEEWANGVRPHSAWETFVARDLVRAVDARYRTIPTGAGRALAGLSEGGYGALNIGLHHAGEFRVLESWSGYERADPIRRIFGRDRTRLAYDSPLLELPAVAPALRGAHAYVWFYSGFGDGPTMRGENTAFAAELAHAGIPHSFSILDGGHTWAVWRARAPLALLAAAGRLA